MVLDKLEVAEEIVMPHVVVKLWPGRNDEIKTNLAKRIANVVVEELKVDIGDVSVAFEEVSSSDWGEKVYKKEIRDNEAVYFKPNWRFAAPIGESAENRACIWSEIWYN